MMLVLLETMDSLGYPYLRQIQRRPSLSDGGSWEGKGRYDRRAEEKIWGRRYCRNLTNRASGANHSRDNAKQHNHNAIYCKHVPSSVSCPLFEPENTFTSVLTWSKTDLDVKSPAICLWLRYRAVSLAHPMKPNKRLTPKPYSSTPTVESGP